MEGARAATIAPEDGRGLALACECDDLEGVAVEAEAEVLFGAAVDFPFDLRAGT